MQMKAVRHTAKTQYRKFDFHIHVSVSDLYIAMIGLPYSAAGKYVDRSWEYKNRSQKHECEN
jgi:hypothetical protein